MSASAKKPKTATYEYGLFAEWLAAWHLRLRGYRILERRCKTPVGEIDIIARKGKTLAFIEVKARRRIDDALAAITPSMQNRITRAAGYYLAQNPHFATYAMRFDLIAVSRPFFVRHLDNAWRPAT